MSAAREHYLARFAEDVGRLPGAALPWLRGARGAAIERFAELGLPSTRLEDWKYTNVSVLERRLFATRADATGASAAVEALVGRHALAQTHRLVFVDGRFSPALSELGALPPGAALASLAEFVACRPDAAVELLEVERDVGQNGFDALNAALWADGAVIDVAPGVALAVPVHLLFISTRPELASYPRSVVRVGAGSDVSIVEEHVGSIEAPGLTDASMRIEIGEGARVAYAKLQQEGGRSFHIATVGVWQRADSRFASHSFAFGGQLSRTGISTLLGEEGASAELVGLYVGTGRQHHDHHTFVDHACAGGTSRALYKGVVDGAARAVFNGRVVVRPDAQRTDAQLTNRNLLLSDDAEVDTKPQLEIWADDVKCSHGATVGQLDPDHLHYLRARGLDAPAARALLIRAFAADVLHGVEFPALRARLAALLPGRLAEDMGELGCELLRTS